MAPRKRAPAKTAEQCVKTQPTHRCSDPDHQEKRKAWARDHARRVYASDPEEKIRKQAEWRKANPDKVIEKNRSYYERNKKSVIDRHRAHRESNRELDRQRRRAHREENPDLYWEYASRRRALKRGACVESVPRTEVFDRDGWACQISGCLYPGEPVSLEVSHHDPRYATVDHVIALARGGLHQRSNLQSAHRECNQRKALNNEI